MTSKNLLISFTTLVLLMTCQNALCQTSELEEAKKAIVESNAIYFTSFAKNNVSIFLDRYADDTCLMPANSPKLCGKEAIAHFLGRNTKKAIGEANLKR